MPIYQYKCNECGHNFEELQKFSDDPLTECPNCKQEALVKQVSTATGFCLMGHGWHRPGMKAGSSQKT